MALTPAFTEGGFTFAEYGRPTGRLGQITGAPWYTTLGASRRFEVRNAYGFVIGDVCQSIENPSKFMADFECSCSPVYDNMLAAAEWLVRK